MTSPGDQVANVTKQSHREPQSNVDGHQPPALATLDAAHHSDCESSAALELVLTETVHLPQVTDAQRDVAGQSGDHTGVDADGVSSGRHMSVAHDNHCHVAVLGAISPAAEPARKLLRRTTAPGPLMLVVLCALVLDQQTRGADGGP
jgi:hypothetical protein